MGKQVNKKRKFEYELSNTKTEKKEARLLFSRAEKNFTKVLNNYEPELRETFSIAGAIVGKRLPDHVRDMAYKNGLWLQVPTPGDLTNASVHVLNPPKNLTTEHHIGRDLNNNLLSELDLAATTSSSSSMQTPTRNGNQDTPTSNGSTRIVYNQFASPKKPTGDANVFGIDIERNKNH